MAWRCGLVRMLFALWVGAGLSACRPAGTAAERGSENRCTIVLVVPGLLARDMETALASNKLPAIRRILDEAGVWGWTIPGGSRDERDGIVEMMSGRFRGQLEPWLETPIGKTAGSPWLWDLLRDQGRAASVGGFAFAGNDAGPDVLGDVLRGNRGAHGFLQMSAPTSPEELDRAIDALVSEARMPATWFVLSPGRPAGDGEGRGGFGSAPGGMEPGLFLSWGYGIGGEARGLRLLPADVGATILYACGGALPVGLSGRIRFEVFSEGYVFRHEPHWIP